MSEPTQTYYVELKPQGTSFFLADTFVEFCGFKVMFTMLSVYNFYTIALLSNVSAQGI